VSLTRTAFVALLDGWLQPHLFTDVAENGLQVEGGDTVARVVCGVTANRALIERAIDARADTLVVHHGLFWGTGTRRITGFLKERLRLLLQHNINLFAHHLPLDAHPQFGNNAGLAAALELQNTAPFGRIKGTAIGLHGTLSEPMSVEAFSSRVSTSIGVPLHVFGPRDGLIKTVGLCSGGAPDFIHDAHALGLDAYLTGESREDSQAMAHELGVVFVAAGHHATERFGARALAAKLNGVEGITATFIDVDNPA
jgi:dinuclear metal center YbgI/SA1388 family protein